MVQQVKSLPASRIRRLGFRSWLLRFRSSPMLMGLAMQWEIVQAPGLLPDMEEVLGSRLLFDATPAMRSLGG